MKPPGTVQFMTWQPRDLRELVRVEAKARKMTQSRLVEIAVRDLIDRWRKEPFRLVGDGGVDGQY